MDLDIFWFDDCNLIYSYVDAYYNRLNMAAWMNGLYIYSAVSTVISNVLSKKGHKKLEYPSKPFDLRDKQEELAIKSDSKKRDYEYRKRLMQYY